MMERDIIVVKRIERTLPNAFVGDQFMDIKVVFTVIRENRKSIFGRRKVVYDVEQNIPYISKPFYDGEYNTNRRLGVLARIMEEEANSAIREDKIKNEDCGK